MNMLYAAAALILIAFVVMWITGKGIEENSKLGMLFIAIIAIMVIVGLLQVFHVF